VSWPYYAYLFTAFTAEQMFEVMTSEHCYILNEQMFEVMTSENCYILNDENAKGTLTHSFPAKGQTSDW